MVNAGCDDSHVMVNAACDSDHVCVRSRYKKPRFDLKVSDGLAAPREPVMVIKIDRHALGLRKAGLDIPDEPVTSD